MGFKKKSAEVLSAISDFSSAPLGVWLVVGFLISSIGLLYGSYVFIFCSIYAVEVLGYLSIFLSIILIRGLLLISLGLLSEHITKIYNEGIRPPNYIVLEKVGFDDSK